jgi:hypothetical protein
MGKTPVHKMASSASAAAARRKYTTGIFRNASQPYLPTTVIASIRAISNWNHKPANIYTTVCHTKTHNQKWFLTGKIPSFGLTLLLIPLNERRLNSAVTCRQMKRGASMFSVAKGMKVVGVICGSAAVLAACGLFDPKNSGNTGLPPRTAWISDGALSISRSVPNPPAVNEHPPGGSTMLGFAPHTVRSSDSRLTAVRSDRTIVIMDGASTVQRISGEGIEQLKPGKYTVAHKQRAPLWYAPDQYFSRRSVAIPPANHQERYRRGALGEFALFLDSGSPIHAGSIWSEDVGGVRVAEEDMARLYYAVAVGATLEVQ